MDSLLKKLNYKSGMQIWVSAQPTEFEPVLSQWQEAEYVAAGLSDADFFIIFVQSEAGIATGLETVLSQVQQDQVLWFAYPKGTSKRYKASINRDSGWTMLGTHGFEPVRQVAIDEDWSALRFRKLEYIKQMNRKKRLG